MNYIFEILILFFVLITFLQSGIDKLTDWRGNLGWLKQHFSNTILKNGVPLALAVLVVLELATGILAVAGIYALLAEGDKSWAIYSLILSAVTLLFLLFGQRLAKDYPGAQTIVVYFIPVVFALYFLL
ncbi:DoxX family protein [Robertkochia aurantiaca]|uniref:DoxX family protein n=1 Tax=Robertkochia aurantiaca TaxID=2873700 RepID=UPI001CCFF746|nr:DoxX family protein [Robertkochia sp. 3YJGBD-33]